MAISRAKKKSGSVNPSLSADCTTIGGEARVYSGKTNLEGGDWRCPFSSRDSSSVGAE